MKFKSRLPTWNLKDKKVLLRADLNVPLKQKKIIDDAKIQALKPTIDYILGHGGTIVLMTHIGRPTTFDPNLSTQNLVPWFQNHGYSIIFAATPDQAKEKKHSLSGNTIMLLENLRFFPGETTKDRTFAKTLAPLGDYYVNDAFGMLHRDHTSITLLAEEFVPEHRTFGFVIEKELNTLDRIFSRPNRPFVLVIGGKKTTTKIPLLIMLLDKVNTILLCPAIVFTFLKALGKPVGKSLVDENAIDLCITVIEQAKEKKIEIIFPLDYQIADSLTADTFSLTQDSFIPDNAIGISIGPKTIDLFTQTILSAGTIFFNGTVGFLNKSETLEGMHAIFKAMGSSAGTSIIAGGDSVAAAHKFRIAEKIDYISLGGGATLSYLSGEKLPGLVVLNYE